MIPMPPVILTIGASDSSGGAGIQADLKTFTALNCYGASVVTAVAARSFGQMLDSHPLPDSIIRAQLDAMDGTMPINAVKVGLCPTVSCVRMVGRWLREHPRLPVVVDPVITNSRGIATTQPEVIQAICSELLPRATVTTPNRFEAANLAQMEECLGEEDMVQAARLLSKRHGCPVLVTGGGLSGISLDVLAAMDGVSRFEAPTCNRGKVAGAGCAHSAAVAAHLAKGDPLREAVLAAKLYVSAAIAAAPTLPGGQAVLWHGVTVREQIISEQVQTLTPMGVPRLKV